MYYTIITSQGKGPKKDCMVSVSKFSICFTLKFRKEHEVKKYITFFKRSDGILCFKFSETKGKDTFSVIINAKGAYFVRIPLVLRDEGITVGKYNVTLEGGYFVTDIQLGNKEKQISKQ